MAPNEKEVLIDSDRAQTALYEDASRELIAFFTAVKSLYGEATATTAVDHWLEEFEIGAVQIERTLPLCWLITVAAASRLGDDKTFAASTGLPVAEAFATMAVKYS